MTDPKVKLNSLIEIILTEDHPGKLRSACRELYDFFCEIAALNEDDAAVQNGTILAQGKAISPLNAARCLWEYKRTAMFMRGVTAAFLELRNRFPNEKIEILYAGCGPFAPLVIPLLERFSPDEIGLTLIDYHEFSITAARRIFRRLDFEKFAPVFLQTDACAYEPRSSPHLIISETMQNALANETQTAITLNLAPKIKDEGIFIPRRIAIELCLADLGAEFGERKRINLGTILELDAENIRRGGAYDFPAASFEIPASADPKMSLMLLTEIHIFDRFRLADYDSSISYPKLISPAPNLESIRAIEFIYITGEKPHIAYRAIES